MFIVFSMVSAFIISLIVCYNVSRWWYYWADMIKFNWRIIFMGPKEYMIWRKTRERNMG